MTESGETILKKTVPQSQAVLGLAGYAAVAAASGFVEWLTFASLLDTYSPIAASIAAFLVATVVNFMLGRTLVFKARDNLGGVWNELLAVFGLSAAAYVLNFVVFTGLLFVFPTYPLAAKILATCPGFVLNYLGRQFWIYSVRPRRPPQTRSYSGGRILEAMHEAVNYTNALAELVLAERGGRSAVLDFGAGDGAFARIMKGKQVDVDAVEIDPDLAKSLAPFCKNVYRTTAEVPSGTYDFIYTINVLEHISDLDGVLRDIRRVMKPGGRMFIFVPAFEVLWTSLDWEVGHVQRFTIRSLTSYLERSGFRIERGEYFDSLGFLAAFACRVLEAFGADVVNSANVSRYDRLIFPISRLLDRPAKRFAGKNIIAVAAV